MIWVYQKLRFDNLDEFRVDVFTFTYYYSNLAVNMKSNFGFPHRAFYLKNECLYKLHIFFSIALH